MEAGYVPKLSRQTNNLGSTDVTVPLYSSLRYSTHVGPLNLMRHWWPCFPFGCVVGLQSFKIHFLVSAGV